jgi:hypothetical protein
MMRHEQPLRQHSVAHGAHIGGSVLDLKVGNEPAVTQYESSGTSDTSANPLEPNNPNVDVQINTLEDAEKEAEKVGKIVSSAEAEAGLPDTVHTTPYPGKDDDTEEEEEKAMMWIGIALIVICCAWSGGWVVFMRRYATKQEQVKAGLLSEEDAGEDDVGEETEGAEATEGEQQETTAA